MRRTVWSATGLFVTLIVLTGVGPSAGQKIPLEQVPREVPKAVLDAVKAKYPGAEITSASKETADGKTSYEVYMKRNGKGLDVTFAPTGAVEVVEQEIDAKDLPPAVRAAVDRKYPKVTFTKVEEISKMKDGKLAVDIYELLFTTTDKKTIEMTIAPDGKVNSDTEKTPKAGDKGKGKGGP